MNSLAISAVAFETPLLPPQLFPGPLGQAACGRDYDSDGKRLCRGY